MKRLLFIASFASALLVAPAFAAEQGSTDADAILRQMSDKLGAARQLRFHAHREIDPALRAARNLPSSAEVDVTVRRPNHVVVKSASKGDVRHVYFDGRNLSLFDAKMKFYATEPMHTSIDGLVEEIDRKYGFSPPVAEFALSDIHRDIRRKTLGIAYLGRSKHPAGFLGLNGVDCHRIALSGKMVDVELWVAVSDQLPRKMIATVKTQPGQPRITVEFSHWDLNAKVTDQEFVFLPPQGALKIPMRTKAEMVTAKQKAASKKNLRHRQQAKLPAPIHSLPEPIL